MDDRLHQYLDGELSPEELGLGEKAEAEAFEALVRVVRARADGEDCPDVTARVMAEVRDRALQPAPAGVGWGLDLPKAFARWLLEPRLIHWRPAYAFAAAAVLALVWFGVSPTGTDAPTATPAAVPTQVFVQFRLDAPEASQVRLAGSFTDWEPTIQLREGSPGVWTALIPLPSGVHDYSFVVDDSEWRIDPSAPSVEDGFGGENSQVAILLPTQRTL